MMNVKVAVNSVLAVFLFGALQVSAQGVSSDVRRVIGSAGDQVSTSNASVSYTIGEPVIHTGTTTKRIYTQGFHQGPLELLEAFDIEIYNAFSPNGDGTNESWFIEKIDLYPENTVLIYNRWGDRIRKFQGYDNRKKVWEGKNKNGKALPAGTYYYVIKAGDGRTRKGYVQITK